MNEYLTTALAEDHRRELLAEARADALAREARAGHKPWWHRLFCRTSAAPPGRTGSLVNGHMAATLMTAR